MTPSERRLWLILRHDRLGFSFRRQHPMGPYVLDFFCAEANLAVELDGASHEGREARDAVRDAWFAAQGIETIRIENDVLDDVFYGYLMFILKRCEERTGRKGKPLDW